MATGSREIYRTKYETLNIHVFRENLSMMKLGASENTNDRMKKYHA